MILHNLKRIQCSYKSKWH